jgi:hypothetical protein
MTPDRNSFKSFSSVRGNVVLAEKTQVQYPSISSVRLSCCLPSGNISVILLYPGNFSPSPRKSLYSSNSVKSIETFVLIDDHILHLICKMDRPAVINTFQSRNNFVFDLLPSESGSLADDTDYEFWDTTLGHLFKANLI